MGGIEQQPDEAVLETGQPLGEVGLPTVLALGVMSVDLGLLQRLHQQRQVLEQDAGVQVLLYGPGGTATEILQIQGLLEAPVVGFDAPAAVIQVGKVRRRKRLGIQQGGGEDFGGAPRQVHPHQAQGHRAVQIRPGLLAHLAREPVGAGEGVLGFPDAGLDKVTHGTVEVYPQAHHERDPALLQIGEQPVGGVAAIKQDQAVGGGVIEMDLGAATLTDVRGDEQAVQGLAVAQIDQLGQAGHRQALVGAKMPGQLVFLAW